jgi:hypothetical protein
MDATPTLPDVLNMAVNCQFIIVNINTLNASVGVYGNAAQKKMIDAVRAQLLEAFGEDKTRMLAITPEFIEEVIDTK